MKTETTALARQKEQHIMRRENAVIDIELFSTVSLLVFTHVSSQGLSLPLLVRDPTDVFISCPAAN